jgi:FAD/FMN-containing dehydrogenase
MEDDRDRPTGPALIRSADHPYCVADDHRAEVTIAPPVGGATQPGMRLDPESGASREVDRDRDHQRQHHGLDGDEQGIRHEPGLPLLHRWQEPGREEAHNQLAGDAGEQEHRQEPQQSAIHQRSHCHLVNDVHSRLNATRVHSVVSPRDLDDVRAAVLAAKAAHRPIAVAGGRHAMGGQQFCTGGVLLDMRGLNRVIHLDTTDGRLTVEGGIQWPALLHGLETAQRSSPRQWGIHQKQTGADRLTIAGALSCNAHGRGLTLPPIVGQIESFELIDARGELVICSRTRSPELFALAIGGYGLFGIITGVTLRLRPRVKVRRVVTIADTAGLMDGFEDRIRDGFEYGDFQFAIDAGDETFLQRGVFSCYQPVPPHTPITQHPIAFSQDEWSSLVLDAHRDKRRAFERYAERYLQTSGQVYWSDAQLSGPYIDGYHLEIDRALGSKVTGSEMITELYVPRDRFTIFMDDARQTLRRSQADVIYGTVRLIERDAETVLAWARGRDACIVINLHVDHTPSAIAAATEVFRELIDAARRHDGSYYLTYHRWARTDQVESCYPRMREFLSAKRRYDPDDTFQSDWYRWHRAMSGS